MFVPLNDDCPGRTEALSSARYTVQLFGDGSADLNVSRICKNDSDYQTDSVWTGKTYFFMRGAGEANLEIEAKEIRDNLTDFDYVGNENIGNESVTLINNGSFEGVFLEDNQATIRIPDVLILLGWRNNSGGNTISLHTCLRNFRLQIFSRSLSQMLRNGKEGSSS